MTFFVMYFILNIFDLSILNTYMSHYSEKRNTSNRNFFIINIGISIVWSYINTLHINNLNLICSFIVIFLFSLQYRCIRSMRFILYFTFLGVGFLVEPIGMLLLKMLNANIVNADVTNIFFFSATLSELIRFLIVSIICGFNKVKSQKLPPMINLLLISIPITSIFVCCLIIKMIVNDLHNHSNFICLVIIIVLILINYFVYLIFERFNYIILEFYEKNILIQELKFNEDYYKEVDKSNKKIRKIKHDLKNQLICLYDSLEEEPNVTKKILKDLYLEIEDADQYIYTENNTINSVLKVKCSRAKKMDINVEVEIQVPKKINLEYSEIGSLFGNLIDNAVEACEKVTCGNRFITIKSKLIDTYLMLEIHNSKIDISNNNLKTQKRNKEAHGIGLSSIQKIVKNHEGVFEYEDLGDKFEVYIILYGINEIYMK